MSDEIENEATDTLDQLDAAGKSLSPRDWLALCERVAAGVKERADAARDDLRKS